MLKTFVIGHLGKDATVNQVNGKNVVNFTVAHTEKWKDQQGNGQERTTWLDCSYWTDRTGIVPYLTKGTQVFVEGQPEVRTFTRADRSTGASFALRVHQIQLLGSASRDGQRNTGPAQSQQQQNSGGPGYANSVSEVADDLPF
jgi:single-strand DNA-binding protein